MGHPRIGRDVGFRHPHFSHMPPMFRHRMYRKMRKFMPYTLEATDTEYIIRMPLPGHEVKDVDVSVKKNCISILTRKKRHRDEKTEERPRKIKSMGEFFWNKPKVDVLIPVEDEIDPETVKAKLSRGILTVTFARIPGTKVEVEE